MKNRLTQSLADRYRRCFLRCAGAS